MNHRVVANAVDATFSQGDAIAIDMPMTVSAVVIYLGIILAGCVVVSIADSFAAKEIATRLRLSNAKAIFTQVYFWLSILSLKGMQLSKSMNQTILRLSAFHCFFFFAWLTCFCNMTFDAYL